MPPPPNLYQVGVEMEEIMINFVNTGADEAILKSMSTEGCSEDLIKAMNKQGLVQKDVTVQGKNGKTFTRKQWVKASDVQSTNNVNSTDQSSKDIDNIKVGQHLHMNGEVYRILKVRPTGNRDNLDEFVVGELSKDGRVGRSFGMSKKYVSDNFGKNPGDKISGSEKKMGKFNEMKSVTTSDGKETLEFTFGGEKYQAEVGRNFTFTVWDSRGEDSKISGKLKTGIHNGKTYAYVGPYPLDSMNNVVSINSKCKVSSDTDTKKVSSGISFEMPAGGDAKKVITGMISLGHSRKDVMSAAKASGITWVESSHEGINWMRASMAIQKHLTKSSAGDASNTGSTGSTEPTKSTKNNDSVKTSGLKSNEVCDNIIETCDDLYGDGFVFLDRKEQDEVIQKVADNFGVNSKDIDKMLRSGLDAGGYLLTRNGAELSDEKVFDAVHDYISDLTVQEIDDIDEVVDHIRENYTDYLPLTSKTLKSVKSAVKKILR